MFAVSVTCVPTEVLRSIILTFGLFSKVFLVKEIDEHSSEANLLDFFSK